MEISNYCGNLSSEEPLDISLDMWTKLKIFCSMKIMKKILKNGLNLSTQIIKSFAQNHLI